MKIIESAARMGRREIPRSSTSLPLTFRRSQFLFHRKERLFFLLILAYDVLKYDLFYKLFT